MNIGIASGNETFPRGVSAWQPWIGMVDLRTKPESTMFDGAPGAYCTVLCLAKGTEDYGRIVQATFAPMALEVIGYDEVEPLGDRISRAGLPDDVLELASQLSMLSPVVYDTFYVYLSDRE